MKTKKRLGVYAGRFDPLTVGHLWMIEQGVALFDQLVVAVGINSEILQRFLDRQRIFSTEHFFQKYERQARRNLENSIQKLSR